MGLFQTKGKMRMTMDEANELCDRVPCDKYNTYKKEDFILLLTK